MFQKVIFLLIGAGTVISAAAVAAADIRSSSFLDRCTQSKKYFTVIDCTTAADKSELVVNNPNATTIVSNCQFNGCGNIHAQTQIKFSNVIFNGSMYAGSGLGGGAVLIDNTVATFGNVQFINCVSSSSNGGAVYLTQGPFAIIPNTIPGQGSLTVAYFSNVLFSGNSAQQGGAIFGETGTTINMKNSRLMANSVSNTGSGGSIYMSKFGVLNLSGVAFSNGFALQGGDIYHEGADSGFSPFNTLNKVYISWIGGGSSGSSSGNDGGSIFLDQKFRQFYWNVTLQSLSFTNMTAGWNGGILSSIGSASIIVDNIQGSQLKASEKGAALHLETFADVIVSNSIFNDARVKIDSNGVFPTGGTIFITSMTGPITLQMSNCVIKNSAVLEPLAGPDSGSVASGGFLFVGWNVNAIITHTSVTNASVIPNAGADITHGGRGGAIAFKGTSLIISDSSFTGCGASNAGGALFLTTSSDSFVTTFSLSIIRATFNGNYAAQGGAVYATFGDNSIIADSSFVKNTASVGGAIGLYSSKLTLSGSLAFNSNGRSGGNRTTMGGAIYMDAESSLIIATTKLGMTGNVAAFGSDIFNWNMVSPSISYLPSSSNAAFDVEGSVFFADQQVANAVASSNPFTWHQPQSSLAKTLLLCDVTASNHTLTSKACNQKTTPPANQNEPLPIHLLDPPTFILKFSIE